MFEITDNIKQFVKTIIEIAKKQSKILSVVAEDFPELSAFYISISELKSVYNNAENLLKKSESETNQEQDFSLFVYELNQSVEKIRKSRIEIQKTHPDLDGYFSDMDILYNTTNKLTFMLPKDTDTPPEPKPSAEPVKKPSKQSDYEKFVTDWRKNNKTPNDTNSETIENRIARITKLTHYDKIMEFLLLFEQRATDLAEITSVISQTVFAKITENNQIDNKLKFLYEEIAINMRTLSNACQEFLKKQSDPSYHDDINYRIDLCDTFLSLHFRDLNYIKACKNKIQESDPDASVFLHNMQKFLDIVDNISFEKIQETLEKN